MTLTGSSQNFVRPIISSRMIAALLTRMSTRPVSCRPAEERLHLVVVAMIDGDRRFRVPPAAVTLSAVSSMVPAERDSPESLVRPVT